MKHFLPTTLTCLFAAATSLAQPITIDVNQSPALHPIDVNGKSLPAIQFTGKNNEVFPLPLTSDQGDWGGKGSLVLKLHNATETDGQLVVFIRDVMDDKSPKHFPRLYHWSKVAVDWVGWREVEIPFTDFKPSTGQLEIGARDVPAGVSQIWFGNQIGPEDPALNTWGVPAGVPFTLGIESITVRE